MGNVLFDVDIAGIIAEALGDGVLSVTITRQVDGPRDPNNPTGGRTSTPRTFAAQGFWEDVNVAALPAGTKVELTDRVLVLLGDTIEAGGVPQRNDACTVEEAGGPITLYAVQPLRRDPAAAVYTFLCRDRRGPDGK